MRYPRKLQNDHATATIYRQRRRGFPTTYCLLWKQSGETMRRTYTDENEAVAEGEKTLEHLVNGRPELVSLGREQALEYAAAIELIRPTSLPLVTVVREYMRTWKPGLQKATVRTCIKKWLEKNSGRSKKHQKDSKYRMAAFESDLGGRWIDEVQSGEVRAWIEARKFKGEKVSNRTRTNWLRMLCALWNFARSREHLPEDKKHNLDKIEGWPHDPASYSFMKARDMTLLMELCNDHDRRGRTYLVPFVALLAFGGIRTEEAKRLTYEDLVIRGGQVVSININAKKSKTKTRRTIDVLPCLASYLRE